MKWLPSLDIPNIYQLVAERSNSRPLAATSPGVVAAVPQTLPDRCIIDGEIDRCYVCLGFERLLIRLCIYRLTHSMSSLILFFMALRYALLGFLSLRALSGYDLKRLFDTSVRHFWTADQAQIYRTLAQLAEEGLVEVRVIEQDKRPDRKEHRVTKAGLAELEAWLRSPLESVPVREPFLLRLFFAGRLPKEEVSALLSARRAEAEELLSVLEGLLADVSVRLSGRTPDQSQRLQLATLDNGIRHVRTELEWLESLGAQIKALRKRPNQPRKASNENK